MRETVRDDNSVEIIENKKSNHKISIAKAHSLLGHGNEKEDRKTAKALGWTMSRGTLPPCQACAEAKAKQKNISKDSPHEPSTENNGRVFLD